MKEMRKPTVNNDDANLSPNLTGEQDAAAQKAPERRSRPPFRSRLFAMLLLFALIPTVVTTLIFAVTASRALSLFSADSAWERVARSADSAFTAIRPLKMSDEQKLAVSNHESEVRASVELAKRFGYVAPRTMRFVALGGLAIIVLVAIGASRVAGHLSRQLSRPLDELVGWTGLIRSGEALPKRALRRGAPEFDVLRSGMRTMAAELEEGRKKALEAERAEAFRESARRFAHELKNPLTPIRFAVSRLRRDAPTELQETVEVLAEEASRLETMARSFAQFGRLPDGPPSDVDIGELVTKAARAAVPERMTLTVEVQDQLPLISGHHEPLVRAVSNILVNAVEACEGEGAIAIKVIEDTLPNGRKAVAVIVGDSGPGMSEAVLSRVFDPYVTTKPGGTGLGLAIARQTVSAHNGLLEVYSKLGEGTEFRMRIPVQPTSSNSLS